MSATNKSRLTLAEVGSTGYTYKKMKPERPSTLPPEDRPREKLYRWGCEQLSDAELLTILLQFGGTTLLIAALQ